jgi:hypothetical protein
LNGKIRSWGSPSQIVPRVLWSVLSWSPSPRPNIPPHLRKWVDHWQTNRVVCYGLGDRRRRACRNRSCRFQILEVVVVEHKQETEVVA